MTLEPLELNAPTIGQMSVTFDMFKQFACDYLAAVDAGTIDGHNGEGLGFIAKPGNPFTGTAGLCLNFTIWLGFKSGKIDIVDGTRDYSVEKIWIRTLCTDPESGEIDRAKTIHHSSGFYMPISNWLDGLWELHGLGEVMPFNGKGEDSYYAHYSNGTHHTVKSRIEFLRNLIAG